MSQTVTGVRAILSRPWVYSLSQTLLGCTKERRELALRYLQAKPGMRVLDIGCGTGEILEHLPEVDYFGFDLSSDYIKAAQRRYGHRGTFRCQAVDGATLDGLAPFDLVISLGVLHHLDDDQVVNLFGMARQALAPGGRFVTMDPALVSGQSRFARFLIDRDRGQNVRTPHEYRRLCRQVFDEVDVNVRHDMMAVPYTRAILCGAVANENVHFEHNHDHEFVAAA